jgi:hypothetical protein
MADIKENGLKNDETVEFLDLVGPVITYRVMAEAIKIFSVKLLPEGLVQQFKSSIQSRSSSMPVPAREKDYVVAWLLDECRKLEYNLGEYVRAKIEASGTGDTEEYVPMVLRNSESNSFFSV